MTNYKDYINIRIRRTDYDKFLVLKDQYETSAEAFGKLINAVQTDELSKLRLEADTLSKKLLEECGSIVEAEYKCDVIKKIERMMR